MGLGVYHALRGALMRYRTRHALYAEQPDRHPALKACHVGELIPFKGTTWQVAAIHEQPIAAMILVPLGETHASKLMALRQMRRVDRILTKDELTVRASLGKRAQE